MDFVTVREFRTNPGRVWERVEAGEELVVTRNGRPLALLTRTSPSSLEADLRAWRRARAEAAVVAMRREARERGLDALGSREIDKEIASTRQEARGDRRVRS